jgi:hypothetical protein
MDYVLTRLQAALAGLSRTKERGQDVQKGPILEPPLALSKIQVVMARRPSAVIPIRLMVDGMSPDLLLFKTAARLREGDLLELEGLLTGVGPVQLSGVVDWMLQSNGGFTGQIALKLEPDQREKVQRFLILQRQRSRG